MAGSDADCTATTVVARCSRCRRRVTGSTMRLRRWHCGSNANCFRAWAPMNNTGSPAYSTGSKPPKAPNPTDAMANLQHSTPELLALMQQALAARDVRGAERIAEVISVREPAQEDAVGFLVAQALARNEVPRALNVARGGVYAQSTSARLQ